MRVIRNLMFIAVAIIWSHSMMLPLSVVAQGTGTVSCSCLSTGCTGTNTFCSEACGAALNCAAICANSGCGQGAGDPSLYCTSGSYPSCNIQGYPNYVQGTCNCCLDEWSGCGSDAQCCGEAACDTHTWKCGVNCDMACGGDQACTCECLGGRWEFGSCTPSPILINLANDGNDHLTSAADGVFFDIFANGTPVRIAWTSGDSPVGFLVWDRNRNGMIDDGGELFGSVTRLRNGHMAANGFEALREWDANNDRKIDPADPVYNKLRLWFDANHNGYSELDELVTLQSVGVLSIETGYRETDRQDQWGNLYRYEGTAILRLHRDRVLRRIFDVFFKTMP
jgi:hypothetical protein